MCETERKMETGRQTHRDSHGEAKRQTRGATETQRIGERRSLMIPTPSVAREEDFPLN